MRPVTPASSHVQPRPERHASAHGESAQRAAEPILPIRIVVARHVLAVYRQLGSKTATARALGIHVRTVYRYLAQAGVRTQPDRRRHGPMIARARGAATSDVVTWSGWL